MELETINRLYLELSQFATAKTAREIALEKQIAELEATAPEGMANYKSMYMDLIMRVGMKWPGESRHETAARYIESAERTDSLAAAKVKP